MPDQWERHEKSRWEWGPAKGRRQQRNEAANDDPVHGKTPGKKDPNWCKSSPDKHHNQKMQLFPWAHRTSCGWGAEFDSRERKFVPGYHCVHEYVCEYCGKKFGPVPTRSCPSYTSEVTKFALVKVEEFNERRNRLGAARKWVKGPTHYRRPKAK